MKFITSAFFNLFSEYLVKLNWRADRVTNFKLVNTFIYRIIMDHFFGICNIGWQWFIPTNGKNGITSSFSHLYLSGTFLFYFSNSIIFFPAWSYNTHHVLYEFLLDIHRHQPLNQGFFFFGFVDNSFIIVLMLRIVLFLLVIIICVLRGFQIFYRIISISMWRIISFSTWSIFRFSVIIICLVS